MKMKNLFNPTQLGRRWLAAAAVTAALGGGAALPASALSASVPAAEVTAIMLYAGQQNQECQINRRTPCLDSLAGWTPPPLTPFGSAANRRMGTAVRAL